MQLLAPPTGPSHGSVKQEILLRAEVAALPESEIAQVFVVMHAGKIHADRQRSLFAAVDAKVIADTAIKTRIVRHILAAKQLVVEIGVNARILISQYREPRMHLRQHRPKRDSRGDRADPHKTA